MKTNIRKGSCRAILGLALLFLPACRRASPEVCLREKCFPVEVVSRSQERQRGLQFRRSLPPGQGMLFVFAKSRPYVFWMKDTWIPLDILWIDEENRVVHIEDNVPPCQKDPCPTYKPLRPARYVLELNAGEARQAGFRLGVVVDMTLPEDLRIDE